MKNTIFSTDDPHVEITLDDGTREHLHRHFDGELPGSKFCFQNAEELIQTIVDSFPKEIAEAQPNAEGVKVVSLHFPYEIGTCNVVAIDELTDAERNTLKTVPRGETLARCATSDRVFPTKECQLIMTKSNEVITIYPGELAPPLPPTPETSDPYWDKHVFLAPA